MCLIKYHRYSVLLSLVRVCGASRQQQRQQHTLQCTCSDEQTPAMKADRQPKEGCDQRGPEEEVLSPAVENAAPPPPPLLPPPPTSVERACTVSTASARPAPRSSTQKPQRTPVAPAPEHQHGAAAAGHGLRRRTNATKRRVLLATASGISTTGGSSTVVSNMSMSASGCSMASLSRSSRSPIVVCGRILRVARDRDCKFS